MDAATDAFLAAHPVHYEGGADFGLLLPNEIPSGFVDAKWALDVTETAQRPLLATALRATGIDA